MLWKLIISVLTRDAVGRLIYMNFETVNQVIHNDKKGERQVLILIKRVLGT